MDDVSKPLSSTDWTCTKDSKTNLTWGIRVDDVYGAGIYSYTNYTKDYPQCTGAYCNANSGKFGDTNNVDSLISFVNKQKMCGANNWRLPTMEEVAALSCDSGRYNVLDTRGGAKAYCNIEKASEIYFSTIIFRIYKIIG